MKTKILFFFISFAISLGIVFLLSRKMNAHPRSNIKVSTSNEWSRSELYPCGEVVLNSEPKRIVTFNHNHNDMLETFRMG